MEYYITRGSALQLKRAVNGIFQSVVLEFACKTSGRTPDGLKTSTKRKIPVWPSARSAMKDSTVAASLH